MSGPISSANYAMLDAEFELRLWSSREHADCSVWALKIHYDLRLDVPARMECGDCGRRWVEDRRGGWREVNPRPPMPGVLP